MGHLIGNGWTKFTPFYPPHLKNKCPVCCATTGRRCVNKRGLVLESTSHRERIYNKKVEYVKGARAI